MIATWNVRSLLHVRALNNVKDIMKSYRIDILGIQKMRWKGEEITKSGNVTILNCEHHGPRKEDVEWRSRMNKEHYELDLRDHLNRWKCVWTIMCFCAADKLNGQTSTFDEA